MNETTLRLLEFQNIVKSIRRPVETTSALKHISKKQTLWYISKVQHKIVTRIEQFIYNIESVTTSKILKHE